MASRFAGEAELIVVTRPEAELRATVAGVRSKLGADTTDLAHVLANADARLIPIFGASQRRLDREETIRGPDAASMRQLARYFRAHAPAADLHALAARMRAMPAVESAYVKPPAEPALMNDMAPSAQDAPPSTPDFNSRQGYLNAAPEGVDARFAWTLAGGRGAGVRIIDVEGAWNFAHEDLLANQGGVVGGTPPTDQGWIDHGTAVVGTFGGDANGMGVTGICPDASVSAISIFGGLGSAAAIHDAADRLSPGDILLIELHRPGPRFNFADRGDQRGYIAIEWWPDDYDAIRYAIGKGIIVVEAAGNGGENLDDAIYATPQTGFPAGWSNPFARGARDSGAILVGAGAPPPGTHGANHGPDRSRLDFSNYGSAVDVQGWGREVTTTGYGDLQGGINQNAWYTDHFSGTSSASPVIVGTLACAQGVLRSRGTPLAPAQARTLLRTTGSPQQDGPSGPASQRIGSRPDLRQMLATTSADLPVPLYRYWNAQIPDHFYTTDWTELGGGKFAWVFEQVACYVHARQAPGTVPLYRYWNSQLGDHFYTVDWNELGTGKFGWVFESIQCYVHDQPGAGLLPLYRYWNSAGRDHFLTTDFNELGNGRNGWVLEMIQCYVHGDAGAAPSAGGTGNDEVVAAPPASFRAATGDSSATPASFATIAPRAAEGGVPATFRTSGAAMIDAQETTIRVARGGRLTVVADGD
jgi:hypothetical protein